LFERALALDPGSVAAQSYLADALMGRVLDIMSTSATADITRAEGLVGQALATSPSSPLAHFAKGQVLRAQAQALGIQSGFEDAIHEYEMVLASNPNAVHAVKCLAQCKFFIGSMEDLIPLVEQAIRLSPRDPQIWFSYFQIGRTHSLQSRTDEAILWLEKARSANPAHPGVRGFLASAYGLKGETDRAAAELVEARRLRGEGSYSSIAGVRRGVWGVPSVRALYEATYLAGLRKAGMPEE
jgi:adenylate cyclase